MNSVAYFAVLAFRRAKERRITLTDLPTGCISRVWLIYFELITVYLSLSVVSPPFHPHRSRSSALPCQSMEEMNTDDMADNIARSPPSSYVPPSRSRTASSPLSRPSTASSTPGSVMESVDPHVIQELQRTLTQQSTTRRSSEPLPDVESMNSVYSTVVEHAGVVPNSPGTKGFDLEKHLQYYIQRCDDLILAAHLLLGVDRCFYSQTRRACHPATYVGCRFP